MKENLYDVAMSGIGEVIEAVSDSIASEFKGKNPFDKEPISNEDLLYDYNTRGFEIFSQIANTEGIEAAIAYRDKLENLKQKKMGGR